MTKLTKFLFFLAVMLANLATGWTLAKLGTEREYEADLVKAYAFGKQAGLVEAQQSGSCVKWWTGTRTADIQAARRSFCRGH